MFGRCIVTQKLVALSVTFPVPSVALVPSSGVNQGLLAAKKDGLESKHSSFQDCNLRSRSRTLGQWTQFAVRFVLEGWRLGLRVGLVRRTSKLSMARKGSGESSLISGGASYIFTPSVHVKFHRPETQQVDLDWPSVT